MKKTILKQILAALVAFAVCFSILPGEAQAVSATDVRIINRSERKSTDADASYCATPTASAGEKITIYVPIKNYGSETVTDVTCTYPVPTVSGESCPFVISSQGTEIPAAPAASWKGGSSSVDQGWKGASLEANERGYFRFDATLVSTVSYGQQWLTFQLYFKDSSGQLYANPVDIWFTVKTPAEPTPEPTSAPSGGGGSSYKTKPKVLIESYSFSEEKLFAGDPFSLGVVLRNTSDKEAVKNLEIGFTSESGVVTPGSGGSNSIYIGTIEKGASRRLVIPMEIAPDAEAKAQLLNFEITYDGTKNRQEFTTKTSVTVPVQQKIRVRYDNPVVYDEAMVGGSVNMSVQMFNLGKSTLYNCMVEVVGSGLSLEETYFGGNVASGGTMRADLTIRTDEPGEIDAVARVTYEDVFGDPYTEDLPFHLTVNAEMMPIFVSGGDAVPADAAAAEAKPSLPWYVWVLAGAAVLVLLVLLILKGKQRRARELEDL